MAYTKLVVDGKLLYVCVAGSPAEDELKEKANLRGIEILPATGQEYMDDYRRRYGDPVEV